MGFIQAFKDALGGTFADQWLDYYMPPSYVPATALVFPAVTKSSNNNRGQNNKGSQNIISNGSKILVPEGTALVVMQDGAITGFIVEPGGYIFDSKDPLARSFFAGDGIFASTLKPFWERFKFGGMPASQQLAFYVNLKEVPSLKFGTQSEIYWDDAFMRTQVGAMVRGTYTLKVENPLLFVKNFVPSMYLNASGRVFDLADMDNPAGEQLFNEVVASLSAAFAYYSNDPNKQNRISNIQKDALGFGQSLAQVVEENYKWESDRGLKILKSSIVSIEYDEDTKKIMHDVKSADALSGDRGNSFMQQSVARGIEAAGSQGGGAMGMGFLGMGMQASGQMMGSVQQNPANGYNYAFGAGMQQPQQPVQEDPYEKLLKMKQLLDAGAISQEDYDQLKKKLLGL